jgi:hypothetical protein
MAVTGKVKEAGGVPARSQHLDWRNPKIPESNPRMSQNEFKNVSTTP